MTRAELLKSRRDIPPLHIKTKRPSDSTSSTEVKKRKNSVELQRELARIEREFAEYENY